MIDESQFVLTGDPATGPYPVPVRRAVRVGGSMLVIGVLTALFSVGWFGVLAIVEASVPPVIGLWLWVGGLLVGSLAFGVLVTVLRERPPVTFRDLRFRR